jgi:hypothetical protein
MFQKASELKLRFSTPIGSLSTEDLWDLPLTSDKGKVNLNDIAKDLYKQVQDSGTPDFVSGATKTEDVLQLKFDIVKCVIDEKKKVRDAAAKARERKETIQQLQGIVARKKDQELEGASLEELEAKIAQLKAE